jgi:hypothetical protein
MNSVELSLIAFVTICGGALLGTFIRPFLSDHHLSTDSRDVMKLGTSMIATMAALVLSLLISSAKGTFDTIKRGVNQLAADLVLIDSNMALYGPETRVARDILRHNVINTIERVWPGGENTMVLEKVETKHAIEDLSGLRSKLRHLSPQNNDQRQLQSETLQILDEANATRLLLIQHLGQRSFPMPIFVLVVFWLTIIFINFGVLTPRNTPVFAVLFVCALVAASALYLILELDQPFGGVMQISSAPVRNALASLGQ